MTSGIVATLVAVLALAFVEGMGAVYPARRAWQRLRSQHGRRAVRAMRERFEAAAARRTPYVLALFLGALVAAWVAASGVLDKHWYEVLADAGPHAVVAMALVRLPGALRRAAARMRDYERDAGEDPDGDGGLGGDAVAVAP